MIGQTGRDDATGTGVVGFGKKTVNQGAMKGLPLLAHLHVSNFFDSAGKIRVSAGKEVWIDIGMAGFNNLLKSTAGGPDGRTGSALDANPNAFLVGFEPLMEKYSVHLAAYAQQDGHRILGHCHDRGIIFPFAVGPSSGQIELHVSNVDGCTSTLKQKSMAEIAKEWGGNGFVIEGCSKENAETRIVPSVRMDKLLGEWIPKELKVGYMKLDIQGAELMAISSAGALLKRVDRIMIELTDPKCSGLVEGGAAFGEIADYLEKYGYVARYSGGPGSHYATKGVPSYAKGGACKAIPWMGGQECELNVTFVRQGVAYTNPPDGPWLRAGR